MTLFFPLDEQTLLAQPPAVQVILWHFGQWNYLPTYIFKANHLDSLSLYVDNEGPFP